MQTTWCEDDDVNLVLRLLCIGERKYIKQSEYWDNSKIRGAGIKSEMQFFVW